jgi:serine protease Do
MMSDKYFSRRKWVFIFIGVIVGLIIAASFQWTHESQAQSYVPESSPPPIQTDTSALSIADQLSNAFANVAARVNPSVVTVFTETDVKVQQQPFSGGPFDQFFGDDFFKRFFQFPQPQGNMKRMGLGSGVIIDKDGIILTNNHVVDDADNIKVSLMDGREFEAKVKGTDPQTDLAVITIDAKDLQPIKLGNSDKARVGDWVLAIGSPLNPQLEHTVTSGIISAKGRSAVGLSQYEDYIQTDAAINPGNSGGALVNLRGELIGINSAIATKTGGFMGIGFAIPVNLAQKVTKDIIEKGKVIRGWLGVYIQNISPEIAKALKLKVAKGVIVSKVQKDSPAEKAGLKEEDVILSYNGQKIDNSVELSTRVAGTSPGANVNLEILRDGSEKSVSVKLGELTPEKTQLAQGQTSYSDLGLKVSNITSDLISKYGLPNDQKGVIVTAVEQNSVATQVGIQEGDVIIKLNRVEINSVNDFNREIQKVKPGGNVLFYVKRGNGNFFVAFTMPEK